MFRTSNIRGQQRFDNLRLKNFNRRAKIDLTPNQITLIENAECFTLGEKIELFLVALGNKLTTEVFQTIRYHSPENEQRNDNLPTKPLEEDISTLTVILQQLPFIWFQDFKVAEKPDTKHAERFTWFQVSLNEAVNYFMQQYPDDLTEFEEGVLYGYPLSAIRSFSRLIESKHDTPNAATFFLAGFSSQEFWDDEQEYYRLWWERLRHLTPKTVATAEQEFLRQTK